MLPDIDTEVFAMFLKQPNLNVNAKNKSNQHAIIKAFFYCESHDKLSLLLQHKSITLSIVKENIPKLEKENKIFKSAYARKITKGVPLRLKSIFDFVIF